MAGERTRARVGGEKTSESLPATKLGTQGDGRLNVPAGATWKQYDAHDS